MWGRVGCITGAALALGLGSAAALAQAAPVPDRGQLLYATHCIACHTAQVHWRDRKLATDWPRLKQQVRLWQAAARLGWTDADIVDVARHLNETIYRLPLTGDAVGGLPAGEAVSRVARGGR